MRSIMGVIGGFMMREIRWSWRILVARLRLGWLLGSK